MLEQFSKEYKDRVALVTFIYPAVTKYLSELVESINNQNSKDFVVVIFNDGVENPQFFLQKLAIPFTVSDVKGINPMEIRFRGLEQIKKTDFKKIIFQDSDDGLSRNRVQLISKALDDYPLAVNDLDLMDQKGEVFKRLIWQSRFSEKSIFTAKNLNDFNFAGLGNSGITKELLDYMPRKPSFELIAVDWYLFYSMLARSGECGIRTSECSTIYRQHPDNTVGLQDTRNDERLSKAIMLHRKALDAENIDYHSNINQEKSSNPDLFWWETNS